MTLRSMTGFAQQKGEAEGLVFTLSLKSVNHRFLDLHLRLPLGGEALEQELRALLKRRLARGHVELTLTLERSGAGGVGVNRALAAGYIAAYRELAAENNVVAAPDLNVLLSTPGVLSSSCELPTDEVFAKAVLETAERAIDALESARAREGSHLSDELRRSLTAIGEAVTEVELHRSGVVAALMERLKTRIGELLGQGADEQRLLQEAAILADRSDVQEEIVRLKTHLIAFEKLISAGGEAGKKMDFLLQEMNRETNTMLSKTNGAAGEALRITELGLAIKAEMEKSREQVQNVE